MTDVAFRANPNISADLKDHYSRAIEAANTELLDDVRAALAHERPIILKMIELYGAQCWVAGRQSFAEDAK